MLIFVLAVALAACNGGGGSQSDVNIPPDSQVLNVSGRDIAFNETAITATAGKPIAINFKNAGFLEHSLIVDLPPAGDKAGDMGVPSDWQSTPRGIQPGKSDTLLLPALPAGSYKYYCHVPGHDQMVGTLTVQ
jgi:uncharacterized cupredoxin-like copper-binding protein